MVCFLAGCLLLGTPPTAASPGPARPAGSPTERAPLAVTIDQLAPAYIPVRGPVRINGSITNTSDERWRAINVLPFVGYEPITTTAELATEVERDPADVVGDRRVVAGAFDAVGSLDPGDTVRYSIRVPREVLGVTEPGVYWFGVHALGNTADVRDSVADGRARTFLPLVRGGGRPVNTALVIPVRHRVRYAADGSVDEVEDWVDTLASEGALRSLVDFGASAGSRPLTWLVDPAVPDAVRQLVDGNQPRSLEVSVPPPPQPGDEEGDEESATPEPSDPSETPDDDGDPSAATNPAQEPGSAWLERLRESLRGGQILSLPYGDVDIAAVAERDPQIYRRAVRRSSTLLQPTGLGTSPGVASPSGYLDPEAIDMLRRGGTILVTDRMFDQTSGRAPARARTAGRRLLVTSSGAAEGGPGPDDPLAAVALRQRILSEGALRFLEPGRRPLVVVFPQTWTPSSTTGFFDGLDVDWLELTTLARVTSRDGTPVEPEELLYPEEQAGGGVDDANFASANRLVRAGKMLQRILTRNDTVANQVEREALAGLSYAAGAEPVAARAASDRSAAWIRNRLGSVTVQAPRSVTLSSATGRFAASVNNDLEFPVSVRVEAVVDHGMTIEGPDTVDVAAGGSTTVLLDAATDRLGVHNVELVVTDVQGQPLGSSDALPIRAARVSGVIWVILGAGVALLFAAIAVRLFRRVRRARNEHAVTTP